LRLARHPAILAGAMKTLFDSLYHAVRSFFVPRTNLQLEIVALRHQLNVLHRCQRGRIPLHRADRIFWVWLSKIRSGWRSALVIAKPETVAAWHRKGFRLYWNWKSKRGPARPEVSAEVRALIRKMCLANPIWGAPRSHGELLKLGIEVSETTVAKYMVRHRKPPSQSWRAFLKNHTQQIVSVDFFVVPTLSFRILFVFVVLEHHPEVSCISTLRLIRQRNGRHSKCRKRSPGINLRNI
jgi:putative transposase